MGPAIRQVLVVEDRHRTMATLEGVGDLQEQLEARIQLLLFVVDFVVTEFGDKEHAVHGEFVGAEGQRLVDRGHPR
ncbi:MAG TPA: hypothetical protein DIC52_10385 [Candidatus Latescibacteria bacterium]|nr:hypothetical protein [Candidatus Latescibacterota bacterium]